ncbi:MAG: MMPL family transporter [bacterium]
MLESYCKFLYKGRWPLAVLFILLFAFSLYEARHLKLKSDFKELLPENFQSVKDLNRIIDRVGGVGSLVIAVESPNPQDSIRFANDLVARLKQYPPEFMNRIEYNISETKKFFEDNKYLYMNTEDLEEIRDRLQRRIQKEKLKTTGLYMDLLEKDEQNDTFSTKDIEDKYRNKTSRYDDYIDGYFFGEKGKLMAIVLKPPGSASGIDFSKKLVAKVNETIASLDPKKYNPEMKVGLTGKFRRVLFEYQTLIEDIVSTVALCVALVTIAVLIYYRKVRMVVLMAWAVFNGTAWTFALTAWKIGYLTTQTAFLGSIIVGNGINYGLIFMARYLEERKEGRGPYEALRISLPATFTGTLVSSLTTAVSFGTLLITQIRGFSHFGFIGGVGMFLCWIATYTVLPVFLSLSEQIWPVVRKGNVEKHRFSLMEPVSRRIQAWAKPISLAGLLLSLLCFPLIVHFAPNSLEYDFSKLRVKSKGHEVSEEASLSDRVNQIFTGSMTPAVLVADRVDQVLPLCREIMRKNDLDPPEKRVIDSCKTVFSHVPEDQDRKIEILGQIRKLMEDNALNFLNEEQKKEVEKFKKGFFSKKVTLEDIPETVLRNYREKNGDLGKIVFVYPADNISLWDGKVLMKFADLIRSNRLPTGETLTASGDSVIFSDLLRAVIHDGPRATIIAFLAVCLVVALLFRERKAILFIVGTLCLGVLWMGGVVALFGIKINFFNFIAIPTTFGIGVDYGVNIYQRYQLEGKGSLPKVLRTTGGAVLLCSITTVIGYFTLIIAKNQALVSFGWIAIIGELTCIAAALVFVPAFVIFWESRKGKMSQC